MRAVSTTSSTSPNQAAAPIAQPCRPRHCWRIFLAPPTNFRAKFGRTTTGAFSTAFFVATTAQSRRTNATHAQSIDRSPSFGCHCPHIGCGDWLGFAECEASPRARAWFALARPTQPTNEVVGHLNQSQGKSMHRCHRGISRAPRITQ